MFNTEKRSLYALKVDFELILVDRKSNAQKSDKYLALNPSGRIPTLIDGERVIFESPAICIHLAESNPSSNFIPNTGSKNRSKFFQWMMYCIFIAIHVHILAIAWLLSEPLDSAMIIWGYTIVSALVVNALKGKQVQCFVAANLMCYGLFLLIYLSLPNWFLMVSVFFLIKVLFSFSVDHFGKQVKR